MKIRPCLCCMLGAFFFFSSLSSCSNVQWFASKQQAITQGVQRNNISQDDIVQEIMIKEETFIVFSLPESDTLSLSVAQIVQKGDQFAWVNKQKTFMGIITPAISWPIRSSANVDFSISAGVSQQEITSMHDEAKRHVEVSQIYQQDGVYFFMQAV